MRGFHFLTLSLQFLAMGFQFLDGGKRRGLTVFSRFRRNKSAASRTLIEFS